MVCFRLLFHNHDSWLSVAMSIPRHGALAHSSGDYVPDQLSAPREPPWVTRPRKRGPT